MDWKETLRASGPPFGDANAAVACVNRVLDCVGLFIRRETERQRKDKAWAQIIPEDACGSAATRVIGVANKANEAESRSCMSELVQAWILD